MENVTTDTSRQLNRKIGDWVVVTAPGKWFGMVGEIIDRVHENVRSRLDWWIEFTVGHEGAGFAEDEIMVKP